MVLPEREYVVTLKKFKDLEGFYTDMDTGSGEYTPKRHVTIVNKRPISRNTHYLLTAREAETLKEDPRVLDVELSLTELGITFEPAWTRSGDGSTKLWQKGTEVVNTYLNWGLLRTFNGFQYSNWGSDGNTNPPNEGTVTTVSTGKNVDVVIVDNHIDPNHPEFAVNENGTGGSRVQQYNWFQLNPTVTGGSAGTYTYDSYTVDHGCLSAGVVAGNTHGWASDANIYNISPYIPNFWTLYSDYIRVWHSSKTNGNPTIMVLNQVISWAVPLSSIALVKFRGKTYSGLIGTVTDAQATGWGIPNDSVTASFPMRNTAVESDLIDAMNAGVIVVGSAGNHNAKIGTVSADNFNDYNNYFEDDTGSRFYYNRGTVSSAIGAICVGAISSLANETKRISSNCGPRIDIYAPGENILSSSQIATLETDKQDLRNSNYAVNKFSGTSAAASMVAGILACWAELNRKGTHAQALSYLSLNSTYGQITDTKGGAFDNTDLKGSTNRMLRFVEPNTGAMIIDNTLIKDLTITFV